jgi:hypothetical protein
MGLFSRVDIGFRPRNVFEGRAVNLYPFTQRGADWMQGNLDKFSDPVWEQKDRCWLLSDADSSHFGLVMTVGYLQDAGVKFKFYGRLKGWEKNKPWGIYDAPGLDS